MIRVSNLHKSFAGRKVLDGVSFEVLEGETMVVIGASGSGKTVLLKHIVGLLGPDEGSVEVNGVDVSAARGADLERVRERLGVLFQSGGLIDWMTVEENVGLPLREKTDKSPAEIAELVKEKLRLVGLEGTESQYPSELSGGMRKRAGLARAIIREPSILLYDEPTSGLDPVTARKIDWLMQNLQQKLGVTSIVVTHDLYSAIVVGNRIATLHQGKVVELSAPGEFLESKHPIVRQLREAQSIAGGKKQDEQSSSG